MTLKEMQEKREKLLAEARERLDNINENTDESRAAELESQHDTAMAALDDLDKQIDRELTLADAEQRAASIEERSNRADPRRPGADAESRAVETDEVLEYRQAFHEMLRVGGDVSELSAEVREVLKNGVVDAETRQQLTTTGAAGGYTVPTELRNTLIEAMEMTGPMYNENITFGINTSGGGEIDVPALDDTGDSSTGSHAEGADIVDDGSGDVVFAQRVLNAYVFKTPFVKWSFELGQDSIFNVESLLGSLLGKRLGKIANSKLTIGTGTNEPNGVAVAASAGITAASATAIASDEIISLQHSVDPAYRGGAKFMAHDSTIEAIRKLKDGQGNYLWQMGNIQTGTPQSLLGQELVVNQAMPIIATGNRSMLYGDFKEYYVRKVGSPVLGVMRERFWPQLGIAGLIRFDGEIGDVRAIKALTQA